MDNDHEEPHMEQCTVCHTAKACYGMLAQESSKLQRHRVDQGGSLISSLRSTQRGRRRMCKSRVEYSREEHHLSAAARPTAVDAASVRQVHVDTMRGSGLGKSGCVTTAPLLVYSR